jgi:ribosomal protein S27AE
VVLSHERPGRLSCQTMSCNTIPPPLRRYRLCPISLRLLDHVTVKATSQAQLYPITLVNASAARASSDSACISSHTLHAGALLYLPHHPASTSHQALSARISEQSCNQISQNRSYLVQKHSTHFTMQAFTVLVDSSHNDCPKCGAGMNGDVKTCGSCGSVRF